MPKNGQAKAIRDFYQTRAEMVITKLSEVEPDCALCEDAQWWIDNGFSQSERKAICGPGGLNCPGFEHEG